MFSPFYKNTNILKNKQILGRKITRGDENIINLLDVAKAIYPIKFKQINGCFGSHDTRPQKIGDNSSQIIFF